MPGRRPEFSPSRSNRQPRNDCKFCNSIAICQPPCNLSRAHGVRNRKAWRGLGLLRLHRRRSHAALPGIHPVRVVRGPVSVRRFARRIGSGMLPGQGLADGRPPSSNAQRAEARDRHRIHFTYRESPARVGADYGRSRSRMTRAFHEHGGEARIACVHGRAPRGAIGSRGWHGGAVVPGGGFPASVHGGGPSRRAAAVRGVHGARARIQGATAG